MQNIGIRCNKDKEKAKIDESLKYFGGEYVESLQILKMPYAKESFFLSSKVAINENFASNVN